MQQRGAMEEPMWRKMFLFFILQFTGAQSRDLSLFYTVRAGDDVTLSCENVIEGHSKCDTTTWTYSKPGETSVELVAHGQVKYICRQFPKEGGGQSGPDAVARLSLVHLSKHENQNMVTLNCSVETNEPCKHSVKWLIQGNYIEKDQKEITESSSSCSAAVTFQTSHFLYQSRFDTLKCEVKTGNKVQLFTFSSRPSEKDETATTSPATTKPDEATFLIDGEPAAGWWRFLAGSLGLAALIAAVVIINIWTRTKGMKTHLDENTVCCDEDEAALNYENIRTSSV
ncbi:uncharacterized protein LOC129356472 isoform X2 [Poeciliopsis prolifica]|uniref:uncharacterized protein LOC129356472 isoform X2 n=1 Tax=Poeciliopsis prolifica TaxID=188132 RepID=UPI0024145693|nr:uncharacterized protein LOC129356472 isoform X2 [Poeciliopsis prolifica]